MQLYAFDADGKLVFVMQALRQQDYFCPECKGTVHLRGGFHRQNHFYHLETTSACRQNGKSAEHLHTQLYFLNQLPKNECFLEWRFPNINRIADVVWTPKQIVFEIQCSSISAEEVLQRNQDYLGVGFEVVWILHDKRFNQRLLTGAEHCLQALPHYFTNIDENGEGIIYDQFSWIEKGSRLHRMTPLPILIHSLKRTDFQKLSTLAIVRRRQKNSTLYFSQDLIDIYFNLPLQFYEYIEAAQEIENLYFDQQADQKKEKDHSSLFQVKRLFYNYMIRPYKLLFQMLLERACK